MAGITDLPTLVEGFRLYCLAEGKRPTTIRWYMGKPTIFLEYPQTQELQSLPPAGLSLAKPAPAPCR